MKSDRRAFLKNAAVTAAVATVGGGATLQAEPVPAARALDPSLLAALGDAVLPESLGVPGRAHAVRAFASWLAAYRPVAEQMHGYGDQEITYSIPDPAPGWQAQLQGLDVLSQRRNRRGFGALDVEARRSLLRSSLGRERGGALPSSPLAASHVAVALLSHWAGSSDATDLLYSSRIARGNCRLLADVVRKPLPLAQSGER